MEVDTVAIMWRVGAVLILAAVFVEESFGDYDDGHPLERHKRHYDCPPHCYYRPRYGPPPPPYWPPPPPPHGPPHPPPQWYQYQQPSYNEAYPQAEDKSQAIQSLPDTQSQGQGQPCTTCGQSSAVSNAQSDTGSAVAVAIARATAKANSK